MSKDGLINQTKRTVSGFRLDWSGTSRILAWPVLCLLLATGLWYWTLSKIETEKQACEKKVLEEVTALCKDYAQYLAQAVEQANQITLQLQYAWEQSHGRLNLQELSKGGIFRDPEIVNVLVINREGMPVTTSHGILHNISYREREYFVYHKNDDSKALLVGKPVVSKSAGKLVITFSRRLVTPRGAFDGVALVAFAPLHLTDFFAGSFPGKTGLLMAVGLDGTLRSATIGGAAQEPKSVPLFNAAEGASYLRGKQWFYDGISRYVAWKTLKEYPLVAMAGLSEQEYFAPHRKAWATDKRVATSGSIVLLLFALAAAGMSVRLVRRKHQEEEVRKAYRIATEGGKEGFYMFEAMYDKSGAIADFILVDCNERGAGFYGITQQKLLGTKLSGLYPGAYFDELLNTFRGAMASGFHEDETRSPLESRLHIEWAKRRLVRSGNGLAVTVQDISERKRSEEKLHRLNRELRAISNCNQALMRATDEQSLLDDICRIVCDEAGYRMAWVGYAENDDEKTIRPVAWAGVEEGYLAEANITWADTARGRGPTGTAIRNRESACIQDFTTAPRAVPWRENALQRGYRSSIALPLKDETENPFGALTIYSTEPNAFTADEIGLLEELAGDLAFGIIVLRARNARREAERNNLLMSFALDNVREAAYLIDRQAHFQYVNEEACRVLGYSRNELLGKQVADVDPDFPLERWPRHWEELKLRKSLMLEGRHRAMDGRIIPVEISASYIEFDGQSYNLALVRDITERKRAEMELRESEQKFSALFHAIPDLISVTRISDGIILEVNEGYTQLLGYTRAESLGKSTSELSIWTNQADRTTFIDLLEQTGRVNEFETVLRRKDGSLITCLDNARTINFGGETCAISVARDITDRKLAEEEHLALLSFFENMDRVNRAIQGAHDLKQMLGDVLDTVLSIFNCDRAFLMYPCDPESATWSVPMERSKPEYPGAHALEREMPMTPEVAETLRLLLSSDHPLRFGPDAEHPLPADVSERFGFKSFMSMVIHSRVDKPWQFGIHQCTHPRVWTDSETNLLQEIGVRLTDGLTTLLLDRNLRESEAKYRLIVDTANEGVVMHAPDSAIIFVNNRMAEMLGYSTEEMIGRLMTDFMFEEDWPDQLSKTDDRRKGMKGHYERRLRKKDGETVWVLFSFTPILDNSHCFEGSFGMAADITERKLMEEQVISLNKELEERVTARTNDLEAKRIALEESQCALTNIVEDLNLKTNELENANSRLLELDQLKSMFIASMSHELRTPLNSIIGFSSIILDEWLGPVNAEQKENLDTIKRAGKHLLSLINDVIDVSKIEAGKLETRFEEFDLHDLLTEAVQYVEKDIRDKGLKLTLKIRHKRIRTDKRRLLQCLINLLSNAVKFTEKGEITVVSSMANAGPGGPGGRESAGTTGQVIISVQDTGIGIAEDDIPRLFKPFIRLESSLKTLTAGTGLGLYLTKKLIEEVMGGDIVCTSKIGTGSTFTLKIPERIDENGT